MITIYLASRYARREEMETYARQLQGLGYTIGSQWVFGNQDILSNPAEAQRFATMDRHGIIRSDLVINFAESKEVDYPRGSRHTEFGMAYERGKVCYVVGKFNNELENIFHNLEGVVIFETWEKLLSHLEQLIIFEKARDTMQRVVIASLEAFSLGPRGNIGPSGFPGNGEVPSRRIEPNYSVTELAEK